MSVSFFFVWFLTLFLSRLNTAAIQVLHSKMKKNHLTRLDTSLVFTHNDVKEINVKREEEKKKRFRVLCGACYIRAGGDNF